MRLSLLESSPLQISPEIIDTRQSKKNADLNKPESAPDGNVLKTQPRNPGNMTALTQKKSKKLFR